MNLAKDLFEIFSSVHRDAQLFERMSAADADSYRADMARFPEERLTEAEVD